MFLWMTSASIKEINRLRKEVKRLLSKGINKLRKERNRLLSKGMSNIYLKVTIEKNCRSQALDFQSLKNLSPGQFFGCSNAHRCHWILKFLVVT